MTLPNRPNYTPGEKRRERKFQVPDAAAMVKTNAKSHTSGKSAGSSATTDDALREELLQVLSGMAPESVESSPARPTPAKSLEHHMTKLEQYKTQVEAARQRLHSDPCYQQLPVKEEQTSLSTMLGGNGTAESDPLEQLLTGMAADTGLQSRSLTNGTTTNGKAPYRLDPQWVALFQHAGLERQQLIDGLGKLETSNAPTELDATMEMAQDVPTRGKYQRSVAAVRDWSKHHFYQKLRATVMARGAAGMSYATRSSPGSPIDSPLRQSPKKRANLSKHAKTILGAWFDEHLHHPYPTEEEKDWLSAQGGITIEQVNNWFINTRGRKWKPMLRRILTEKEAGRESQLYVDLVKKIEQPYQV